MSVQDVVTPAEGIERRIERDETGRIRTVIVRIGCAQAVLVKPGASPGEYQMPSRDFAIGRLAQIQGRYGGPLSLCYDGMERYLLYAGFRIKQDNDASFLSCTRRDEPSRGECDKTTCPWNVASETYGPQECPLDRWKSFRR